MKQELAVHLQVHRGKTLTFNSKGESTNENHPVVIVYDTPEWVNYLKHLLPNGIIKAEVKKVLDLTKVNEGKTKEDKDYYQSVSDFSKIQTEVDKWLVPTEAQLTPEQQRIADLEARLDALTNGTTNIPYDKEALKASRAEYEKVTGKKGGPTWDIETINQKIEEFNKAN
jgi:hypothetical protein